MKSIHRLSAQLSKNESLTVAQTLRIKGGDDKRPTRPGSGSEKPPVPCPNSGIESID